MKYKITTIILLIVLIAIVAFSAVNASSSNNLRVGDVNGDGNINLLDVVCLAQYVAGWDVELGGNSSAVSSNTSVEEGPSVESSYVSSTSSKDSDINISSSIDNLSSSSSISSNDGWTGDYIIK